VTAAGEPKGSLAARFLRRSANMLKRLLLAAAAMLIGAAAHAANIATFSQTSGSNTLTASVNGADTETMLTVSNAPVSIGQFIGGIAPASEFSLTAHSVDAVATLGAAVIQHYSGSFCITTGAGCGGVDVLSGAFTDAAFGALGGPGLAVNVNNPPDTLTLSSALVPAADLIPPTAFTLAFTNVSPALAVVGSTLAPFTASFAGTASASVRAVPEPAAAAVLGVGLLGLVAVRRRRRAA
jgi:hypothetical protein